MPGPEAATDAARVMVDHLFRSRAGQMVAYLTRIFGPAHLDLAEEVVQDALVKALQQWPFSGIPDNPGGWLFRVARNGALDVLRRHASFHEKAAALASELASAAPNAADETTLSDDELRMMFMCCHPAIPQDARVALSLKTVGGFSVAEIARAFLTADATIAQRLVRAKRQIRDLGIQLELPSTDGFADRLESVLEVIYLLFNEGYGARSGVELIRVDICGEALRLGRLVADSPATTAPAAHALVALMAFQAARLPARVDAAASSFCSRIRIGRCGTHVSSRWGSATSTRAAKVRARAPTTCRRPSPPCMPARPERRHRMGSHPLPVRRAVGDDALAGRRLEPGRRALEGARRGRSARGDCTARKRAGTGRLLLAAVGEGSASSRHRRSRRRRRVLSRGAVATLH